MDSSDESDEAVHRVQVRMERASESPGWVDGAPTSGRDQSCALCGSLAVTWVHPLDREHVGYHVFGRSYTLPSFWALCDHCEQTYASGDDEAAVEVMKASDGWLVQSEREVDGLIRQPLAVFRRADKGPRRLED